MKLSDREKWLFFLMVLAGLLYVFFQFLYLPKMGEIFSSKRKLVLDQQQLTAYEEKAKVLEKLEMAPLNLLRATKTKEEQTIEALRYISYSLSKLKLDLVSIKPRTQEIPVDFAKAIFFDINFTGQYKDIYGFMKELGDLPILILVDSMNMVQGEPLQVEVLLVLSVYY